MVGRSAKTIQTLHKVVGLSDLYAWAFGHRVFDEVHPITIKKIVTGSREADKEQVAKALPQYVGDLEYGSDDESDAVACGIAWLIQNKYIKNKAGEA